jgi:hypothetical protein
MHMDRGYDPTLAPVPPPVEIFAVPHGTMASQINENSVGGRTPLPSHAASILTSGNLETVAAMSSTSYHAHSLHLHPSGSAGYDPMLAPLPPPFEIFSVPDGAMGSSNENPWIARTPRPLQATGSSSARQLRTTTRTTSAMPSSNSGPLPSRHTHHAGDSAEEPICID